MINLEFMAFFEYGKIVGRASYLLYRANHACGRKILVGRHQVL